MTPAERLGLTLKAIREAQPYFFYWPAMVSQAEKISRYGEEVS
jgi:hypothetical protein